MKANVAKPDTKPTAISTLGNVTEMALQFRGEKPTIASIARVVKRASHLLRIGALDERLEIENGATIAPGKKHSLMS